LLRAEQVAPLVLVILRQPAGLAVAGILLQITQQIMAVEVVVVEEIVE
jgi:hypothetical protein